MSDGEYSSATAKDCLEAVETAYEDGKLTREERDVVRALGGACDRIRSGPGGTGASCTEDAECNRDIELACVTKAGSATGTCQAPVVVMGGFDCSAPDAECVEGFFCDGRNCIRGEAEGDSSGPDAPCADDLQCVPLAAGPLADGGVPEATCVPRRGVGAECATDADCASRICSPRTGAPGVCSASIVLGPTDPVCIDPQ